MTIHTTLTGAGSTPKTFEAKRAEKAESRRRFFPHPNNTKPIKIGIRVLIAERILPHHPVSEKFRGSSSQSHCSPQFPKETLRFIKPKNPTPQHHSRHRENIGRMGSLSVFCELNVIAVFPLKTGDLMFVGFDSQNTLGLIKA